MSFHLHWTVKRGKKYGSFKRSYRKGKKVLAEYVYLGPEERALKILKDFSTGKPDRDQLYSYTGEILLKKVAKRLEFSKTVDKHVHRDTEWDVGEFLETVVIERCLEPVSKWALAQRVHEQSVLALQSSFPPGAFSEDNIYNYMDYYQPFIHSIQADLVEQVYKLFPARDEVLILDGTSLYTRGADPAPGLDKIDDGGDGDNDQGRVQDGTPAPGNGPGVKHVARLPGYSRDKRPDLPQVNVMLGVSQRQIPLYFEVFAGNTVDLTMFEYTLQQLETTYKGLLRRMKERYMVFDRGNVKPGTIQQVDQLCDTWRFDFVAGMKKDQVKEELAALDVDRLPVIFHQNKTELHGRVIEKTVYNRPRKILLYVSKAVRKHQLLEFQAKLEEARSLLAEIDALEKLPAAGKVARMKAVLQGRSITRLFYLKKFAKDGTPDPAPTSRLYQLLPRKVAAKKASRARAGKDPREFQEKLERVQALLAEVDAREQFSPLEKIEEMKTILRKHFMLQLFWFQKFTSGGTPEIPPEGPSDLYRLLPEKVEAKKALFGKFAVMSSNLELTAPEMIRLYKTQEVVEHEFHLLKGLLDMRPFHHRLPHRIDAHVAIVNWAMLLLSVLKNLLEQDGSSYTFEELWHLIQQGYLQKAIFLYPGFKNFQLTRTVGITPELEQVLRIMKIKPQSPRVEYFHLQPEGKKSIKTV